MTTGALNVFNFMKSHPGEEMTKQAIAAELGVTVSTVVGATNWLLKNSYATEREESVEVDGKQKVVKYIKLTDAGLAYDPEAAAQAALEEKERLKAEKAAAKAAAKAAQA